MPYETSIPLGRGAAGEVYKAFDPKLQRFVALKYLRWDDPVLAERLLREARLQARVNHELVCKVYEVGTQNGRPFIAMQYIEGRTLEEAAPALDIREKVRVMRDVAEAVHAAHETGLIHRDLKPQNIMLEGDLAAGAKPYVLDFGLAREHQGATHSESGVIAGTPAYMAPEQARGQVRHLGPATDVYGLGAVLYRLLTGRPPFEGGSELDVAIRVVQEDPPAVRTLNPDVPGELESIAMKCLEKNTRRRYASALELARDLDRWLRGEPVSARPQTWVGRAMRRLRRRRSTAALAVLGAAWIATLGVLAWRSSARNEPPVAPQGPRRSVAVLEVADPAGRPDARWMATALSEMLSTELAAGGRLKAIPGDVVASYKADVPPGLTGRDALARVRAQLGVDLVVLGSYAANGTHAGAPVQLDLRVHDAATGDVVATTRAEATVAELAELASASVASVRDALGLAPLSKAEADALHVFPSHPDATRLYAEGLARLRAFDAITARRHLEQAAALQPRAPLLHSTLADAWSRLGYERRAQESAAQAFALASGLPREQALVVEGRYRQATQEWDRALEIYKTLWIFFPDNLDYGLALAEIQNRAQQAPQAFATLDSLRALPAPLRDDPRIDILEANAAQLLGDHSRVLAATERASAKARNTGARVVLATARITEGWSLYLTGRAADALAALADGAAQFRALGDRGGEARALGIRGQVLRMQSELDQAQAAFEESIRICDAIGNVRLRGGVLAQLSAIVGARGDAARAQAMNDEAVQTFRDIGDRAALATALLAQSGDAVARGDFARAEALADEAVALRRELGNKAFLASALDIRAQAYLNQGRLASARKSYEEALELARAGANKPFLARALKHLGKVAAEEARLADGRTLLEEALALQLEQGQKGPVAHTRLDICELLLADGDAAGAEREARAAVETFAGMRSVGFEGLARAFLASALAAQGRAADARVEIGRADRLARQDTPIGRAHCRLVLGRALTTLGQTREAARELDAVVTAADQSGQLSFRLEAQLARGELDRKARAPGAEARLEALAAEARRHGFEWVAQRADRVRTTAIATTR